MEKLKDLLREIAAKRDRLELNATADGETDSEEERSSRGGRIEALQYVEALIKIRIAEEDLRLLREGVKEL